MLLKEMKPVVLSAGLMVAAVLPAAAVEPDPVTADPAAVAAMVLLPAGLSLPGDGTTMVLSAVREDNGAQSSETYVLRPSEQAGIVALSAEDQARLAAQQAVILGWMDQGIDVDGSFSMAVAPCLSGTTVSRRARMSIRLRADFGGGFHTVIDDMRVRRVLGHPVDELAACDAR